jgi:hypothetical protein
MTTVPAWRVRKTRLSPAAVMDVMLPRPDASGWNWTAKAACGERAVADAGADAGVALAAV